MKTSICYMKWYKIKSVINQYWKNIDQHEKILILILNNFLETSASSGNTEKEKL